MKKERVRAIIRTYIIITSAASMGLLVRWVSGKFTLQFNILLFFVSFIFISVTWEFLNLVNNKLNKILPFEKNIPQRILLQLSIGAIFALIVRYGIYKFGEPNLDFKLDSLFRASTWVLYVLGSAGVNIIFFLKYFIKLHLGFFFF